MHTAFVIAVLAIWAALIALVCWGLHRWELWLHDGERGE